MATVSCTVLLACGLALASASAAAAGHEEPSSVAAAQPIEAVLLRPDGLEATSLLDALQLRSPERALHVPPWPATPSERFELFAVATLRQRDTALEITVVLSDGRAYYRSLDSEPEDAPRLAASTVANLLAAIEDDDVAPDARDVPLPAEQAEPEPEPEAEPQPEPAPQPEPEPEAEPPPKDPFEIEGIVAGTVGVGFGPPDPAGFAGGGGIGGVELRWPRGPVASFAFRSQWHRPDPLTVGRSRISLGGGYEWRRGRFAVRTVLAVDLEPWGVRRASTLQLVDYPDGQTRNRGLQLGGHVRVVPSWRLPLGPDLALRVGPRFELSGSALAQAGAVARLVVFEDQAPSVLARVGGLELGVGLEVGLAWSLPGPRS